LFEAEETDNDTYVLTSKGMSDKDTVENISVIKIVFT